MYLIKSEFRKYILNIKHNKFSKLVNKNIKRYKNYEQMKNIKISIIYNKTFNIYLRIYTVMKSLIGDKNKLYNVNLFIVFNI